jgi:hypothetical protein
MKSHWAEYRNKKIFIADYSNFENNIGRLKNEIAEVTLALSKEPTESVLLLVDVRNTIGTKEAADALKASAAALKDITIKTAVVGVSVFTKPIMLAISFFSRMELRPFDNSETAGDWLTE